MKLNKPKFWNKENSLIAYFLFPLTFLISIYVFFKKKFIKQITFKIPIICVGNIYIGGTGKTPTSITLAKELSLFKKKPVILKKFYKNQKDEHDLIQANFKNLILHKNRISGIKEAEYCGYDMVILDDGFQDYRIKKNLNIVCFNSEQNIGNGFTIPSGPLRENLKSLKYAQIILINGSKNLEFEKKILKINNKLNIFYSHYKPLNLEKLKGKKLLAFAAIGNPENFFKLIEKNNLLIEEKLFFPDHYIFKKNEIEKIVNKAKNKNLYMITTEKDYYKIKDFQNFKIDHLKVKLEINNKNEFIKKVKEFYVQDN